MCMNRAENRTGRIAARENTREIVFNDGGSVNAFQIIRGCAAIAKRAEKLSAVFENRAHGSKDVGGWTFTRHVNRGAK